MAGIPNVKIIGAEELRTGMDKATQAVRNRIVRKALLKGAVIVRDEARRRAPVRMGILKGAIVARTDRDPAAPAGYVGYVTIAKKSVVIVENKKGKQTAVSDKAVMRRVLRGDKVIEKINPRRYAHLVEYGTQPHAVGSGDQLSTKAAKRGRVRQTGGLHPGAKAQPFLRPAAEAKREEATAAIKQVLAEETVNEVVKQSSSRRGKR